MSRATLVRTAFALAIAVVVVGSATAAWAGRSVTLRANNVSMPQTNNGWDYEDLAIGDSDGCVPSTTAAQQLFNQRANDTGLRTTSLTPSFSLLANEAVIKVEVNAKAGSGNNAGQNSGPVGLDIRLLGTGGNADGPTVSWVASDSSCQWRWGTATTGWDATNVIRNANGGIITAAAVNGLDLRLMRSNDPGTQRIKVDAFLVQVTTMLLPPAPVGVSVGSPTPNSLQVSWSPGSGGDAAAFYDVERSTDQVNWTYVAGPPASETQITDGTPPLAELTTYYYRVRARNEAGSSGNSATASGATTGFPTQIVFRVQPSNGNAVSDLSPAVEVEILNAQGLRVTNATGPVTITMENNPCGVTLTGGGPISASAGLATFPNLRLNRACNDYSLRATYSSLSVVSNLFNIDPGPPHHLGWYNQPHPAPAGQPIEPSVEIQDAADNRVVTATNLVTIALNTNPCAGSLFGSTTVAAVSGLASFPDVYIDKVCSTYDLQASGLDAITSNLFSITAGAPDTLVFPNPIGDATIGRPLSPVVVEFRDAFGNVATTATLSVTLTLATNTCGAILSGGEARSPVLGIVTFDGVQVSRICDTFYTLRASAGPGFPVAFSSQFNVVQFQASGDDLLAGGYGFDAPDGSCQPNGWTGEPMDTVVFAHVSPRFVVNNGTINMGTKALWFGADSTSAASEVSHWVYGTGFGNHWSQRLTSPAFDGAANRSAVLSFDATVDLQNVGPLSSGSQGNQFVAAQVLDASGQWRFLATRFAELGGGVLTTTAVTGKGMFLGQAFLNADGNEALTLGPGARVRVVVQTDSALSAEDGGVAPGRGAAVVDNVRLLTGATPVTGVPSLDFEAGGLQGWVLSARNGLWRAPDPNPSFTRDVPPRRTEPQLMRGSRFGEDANGDPTCVWSFLAAGDTLGADGGFARLRSPWMPRYGANADVVFTFSARLNTLDQRRAVSLRVLGKNAGDARPRFAARATGRVASAVVGNDAATVFQSAISWRLPADFFGAGSSDSLQIVFEIADVAEASPAGFSGRPVTALPLLDNVQVAVETADVDHDGIADLNGSDLCVGTSAARRDADGNGCPDPFPTWTNSRYWAIQDRPLRYAFTVKGDSAIVDGSEFADVRAAIAAWQGVSGASVTVQETAQRPVDAASAADGVNLITWSDAITADGIGFPPGVLALTSRTTFTRQTSFNDRLVAPGRVVDCDIRFNPAVTFSTSSTGPIAGAAELYPVALHEVGHFFGLSHSVVTRATMFPGVGGETATLEDDDRSALASRFPGTLGSAFGSISGVLTHGQGGAPVKGAQVMALRLDATQQVVDTTATDYSDASGAYHLWRLPAGPYAVRVAPVDKFVLQYVDSSLAGFAETNFDGEWWNATEGPTDSLSALTPINVTAGVAITGRNIVTNIDNTPPVVNLVQPTGTGVDIDAAVTIVFSEPVDYESLKNAFSLTPRGSSTPIVGRRALIEGRRFVFMPYSLLAWDTVYDVTIESGLIDRNSVPLGNTYHGEFRTRTIPSQVQLISVTPDPAPAGGLITLRGDGFDTGTPANNAITFVGCPSCGTVFPDTVTAHTMQVRVPIAALGTTITSVTLTVGGQPSTIPFHRIQDPATMAPGVATSINLRAWSPRDVALTPDGSWALVACGAGIARTDGANSDLVSSAGPLEAVVMSAPTLKAYAVSPDSGWLCEIGGDHRQGNFGLLLQLVRLGGRPTGVAVSLDGRRVYVTDTELNAVHEVDFSGNAAQILRRFDIGGATLTGAIAIESNGRWALLDTRDEGGIEISLQDDSLAWTPVLATLPASGARGGIAVTPQDNEALFAGGGAGIRTLHGGFPQPPFSHGAIPLGPRTQDVAITPGGRLALVADGGGSRLAVVNLDSLSSLYHQVVGSVYVPGSPAAVAVDSAGQRAAVVSAGSGDITFYGLSSSSELRALSTVVASPGDVIGAIASSGTLASGTQAAIASTTVGARFVADSAFSFAVPPLEQQTVTVAAVPPSGPRTTALPLRVVDPITIHEARLSSLVLSGPLDSCAVGVRGYRPLRGVVTSPRGDLAATLGGRQDLGGCTLDAAVTLWRADAASNPLGTPLATRPIPGGRDVVAAGFWADGRELWVVLSDAGGGEVRVIDTDPASPTFGTIKDTIGPGVVQRASTIAMDPLGRLAAVAALNDHSVTLLRRDGSVAHTISMTTHSPLSLSIARDGRTLVVGGEDRAWFYNLATFALTASSTQRNGQGIVALAPTTRGDRMVGLVRPATLGVWNVDPASGSIGAEGSYGVIGAVGTDSLASLTPAPDGVSVLAPAIQRDALYRFNVSGPTVTSLSRPLGRTERMLARSPDGRMTWMGSVPTNAPSGPDSTRLYTMAPDSNLTLVSGGMLSAPVGTTLPQLVRVKATNGSGNPAAGLPIDFSRSGPGGALDGDGVSPVVRRFTNSDGIAEVSWTLPGVAGSHAINARLVPGLPALNVTATAVGSDTGVRPTILATGPTNEQDNVLATTSLFVSLSQRMDPVDWNATVSANGSPVPGLWSPLDQGRTMVFQPQRALPYGANAVLTVPAGLHDIEGDELEEGVTVGFDVQTAPQFAITYLQPRAVPAGGLVNVVGTGFTASPSDFAVSLGDRACVVLHASTQLLEVQIPADLTPGSSTLQVRLVASGNATTTTLDVLPPEPQGTVDSRNLAARRGGHSLAIAPGSTPSSSRVYVVTPGGDNVHLYDLQSAGMAWMKTIPVGHVPIAIVLHPDGSYAYVANSGSNDISIINTSPGDLLENQVIKTVPLGGSPVSLEVASCNAGEFVLVVTQSDSSTLLTLDGRRSSATLNSIVKQTTPTSTTTIKGAVAQDGGRSFLWTDRGVLCYDLTRDAFYDSIPALGSLTTLDVDRARRGLLYGVSEDGEVLIADLSPNSGTYRQVLDRLRIPGGAATVKSMLDGTLLVTSLVTDSVYVYRITRQGGFNTAGEANGVLVTEVVSALPTGHSPAGIAVDPRGTFALIANEGESSTTRVDLDVVPPLALRMDLELDRFDLSNFGRWYTAVLRAPADSLTSGISTSSVRLADLVPADTLGPGGLVDLDDDGIRERIVAFPRMLVPPVVPTGANRVVRATGETGTLSFDARDTLLVRRSAIIAPAPGTDLPPGATIQVVYDTSVDPTAGRVVVLHTLNGGRTWTRAFSNHPPGVPIDWPVPSTLTDSAQIAVIMVDSVTVDTSVVRGVLALSDPFRIRALTGLQSTLPARVELLPVAPNPSHGRALMRFGLTRRGEVTLEIFDIQGRRVHSAVRGVLEPGWHEVPWHGESAGGSRVRAGVYFVRLRAEGQNLVQRFQRLE